MTNREAEEARDGQAAAFFLEFWLAFSNYIFCISTTRQETIVENGREAEDMERNFETVMIEQCAPVLASLKPAGLFRYVDERLRRPCPPRPQLERTAGRKGPLRPRLKAVCGPTSIWCTSTARAGSALCWPSRRCGISCAGKATPCLRQSDDYAPAFAAAVPSALLRG